VSDHVLEHVDVLGLDDVGEDEYHVDELVVLACQAEVDVVLVVEGVRLEEVEVVTVETYWVHWWL
jgi:hypothetical protein